jgi:hypothetical protein
MPEESATPDLVGRAREATFGGVAVIREFCEDMVGAYEGFDAQIGENLDLGKGIGLPFDVTAARLRDESLIADLTSVEIPDGPYNICWTHADAVNGALLEFLGVMAPA